jgi:hypothetical protein
LRCLCHRGLRVGDGAGDAEVHHLDLAVPVQHHVARLDIAVHDACAVAVIKRPQHAVGNLQRSLRQQPPVGAQQVPDRPAVDVFHHDERDPGRRRVVFAGVVHGDNRRVVQRCGGLSLTPEPGLECLIPGEVLPQRLDRDDAVKTQVTGPIDLGHAAPADDAVELVAAAEQPWLSHVSHLRYRPAS